jgi:hypothetical protein
MEVWRESLLKGQNAILEVDTRAERESGEDKGQDAEEDSSQFSFGGSSSIKNDLN